MCYTSLNVHNIFINYHALDTTKMFEITGFFCWVFLSRQQRKRTINSLLMPAGLTCLYIHLEWDPQASTYKHTAVCPCVHTHTCRKAKYRQSSKKSGVLCHLWLDTSPRPSGFWNVLNGRKVERVLRIEEEGLSFWKNNTGNTELFFFSYSCYWQINVLY